MGWLGWVGLGESSGASRFVKKDSATERVAHFSQCCSVYVGFTLPFERLVGWVV